jgi:histidinol-phosphatase (PHP family)
MSRASGLIDYHLHTERCGHATGSLEEYVNQAGELGLREIGFSDHFPMLHVDDPSLAMALDELPLYVEDVRRLQAGPRPLAIKLGIEVDFLPETRDRIAGLLEPLAFDYVMGSVHYVDGWGFDDPRYVLGYEGRDIFDLWERYFELLAQAAESGLFDIVAHPDLIKKFGYRPRQDVAGLYQDCLDRVAAAGVAVEVSTAGLRKPVGEIYPEKRFLSMCRERDIAVTMGSDAHRPEEVGYAFADALALLRECGYERVATFTGRERGQMVIPR